MRRSELEERIGALDPSLFSDIEIQAVADDRRSLLALHAAVADRRGAFAYLEIGSYRGGSLQVVMRDPRCTSVISIDARVEVAHDDARGTATYDGNTTAAMRAGLAALPGARMDKLVTIEASVEGLDPSRFAHAPDLCFVDGEHSRAGVLRDGRFCAEALGGRGVLAFHDRQIVAKGIADFLHEAWADISHVIAFNGQVLAVELGGERILRAPAIERALASRWHSWTWRVLSRARSPRPVLAACRTVPKLDVALAGARRALGHQP